MLEKRALRPMQFKNIYEFEARISSGLDLAALDCHSKRKIVEALDVRVIFAIKDDQKTVYVQCVLDDGVESFGIPCIRRESLFPTR